MRFTRSALPFVAFIGIVDAASLSYARYTHSDLICGIVEGCNTVAASPYSVLFGMPLAYLGLLFYVFIFILGVWLLSRDGAWLRTVLLATTSIGLASSLYFVYLQTFVIQAYCVYCVISALVSALLWVMALALYRTRPCNTCQVEQGEQGARGAHGEPAA